MARTSPPAMNPGTIHVQVLRATNLPTLDYSKRQDPYVLVRLEGEPQIWGKTDTIVKGGQNPVWTDHENSEIEIFWEAKAHQQQNDIILTVEVLNDEFGYDQLIGTGQVSVNKIVREQITEPTTFTVKLQEQAMGTTHRGEVQLKIWFGPPVRRTFRAIHRMGKLFEIRDTLVGYAWFGSKFAMRMFDYPRAYMRRHKKIVMLAIAALAILVAGGLALFTVVSVPLGLLLLFTFPLWIIPAIITGVVTSPIWVPVVGFALFVIGSIMSVLFGFTITSRGMRSKLAMICDRLKHSEMGKRVIYEKAS